MKQDLVLPARAAAPAAPAEAAGVAAQGFDLFDALIIRRWWRREDLFLHLGERLAEAGLSSLAPGAFATRRIAAEARLRAGPGAAAVPLGAIHAALAPAMGWTAAMAHRAAGIELDCEAEAVRPVAAMAGRLARLRATGMEIAVRCDGTLERAAALRLLARAGIVVPPECVLAAASAVGRPRLAGLRGGGGALAGPALAGRPSRHEAALHAAMAAHPPLVRSALAGAARAARLSAEPACAHRRALFSVGADVAGPLLAGFVLWVLEEARRRGLARLHFVSRDGQVLKRIAETLCARLGWAIECRYLLGSRQAWHLPALERLDAAALAWLAPDGARETLRQVLARAELSPAQLGAALARHGLDEGSVPPAGAVAALLRDVEVERLLLAAAAERRRHALAYLRQEGLFEAVPQAMVDLGWHGRLQRSLTRLLRLGAAEGEAPALQGFYLALRSRPEDLAVETVSAFLNGPRVVERLNPVLVEIFCAADHGTVRRYVPAPCGGVQAELAAPRDLPVLGWGLSTLQSGILAFARELAEAMAQSPRHAPEEWIGALRDGGLAAYELLRREPSAEEAEAFGSFPHADGQTHEQASDCAPRVGALTRLRLGLGLPAPGYAGHWPEGSLRRGGGVLGEGLAAARRLKHRLHD